jgi:DUF971 family protein
MATPVPADVQAIGDFLAIRWSDGQEDFFPMDRLRAWSPSAETMGERDLLGKQYGGEEQSDHSGVRVVSWQTVGGYALALAFSDGHRTGIYSYPYLREIGEKLRAEEG